MKFAILFVDREIRKALPPNVSKGKRHSAEFSQRLQLAGVVALFPLKVFF